MEKSNIEQMEYVEKEEAAEFLKISVRNLANLKKEGKIAFIQRVPRGRVVYKVSDLKAYLEYFRKKAKFEDYLDRGQ